MSHLRGGPGLAGPGAPSPGFRPVPHQGQSPAGASPYHVHSPASSLGGGAHSMPMIDPSLTGQSRGPGQPSPASSNSLPPMLSPGLKRTSNYPSGAQPSFSGQASLGPGSGFPPHTLPPLSSIHAPHPQHDMAPPPHLQAPRRQSPLRRYPSGSKNDNGKRNAPSSNVTSANSSDDEDTAELPASGLVAPWEVLRGLADAAAERAAKVFVC